VSGFLAGLNDRGIVIGRDAALEYRWAEGRYERLPALASELVELRVAVLAAIGGLATALAAKAATQSVPVIFTAQTIRSGLDWSRALTGRAAISRA